jgi:hypothetical protein
MTTLSSADVSALVFLALIVLAMARRTVVLARGAPYSTARLFGYGGFSMVFFAAFAASTLYVAWGTWGPVALGLLAPYAGVVAGAALVAEPHVRQRVVFETRTSGLVYYRLPLLVPLLSMVLFVVRVGVELWMFGLTALTSFSIPTSLSPAALAILIGFDLLYGVSIGLLIGRGLGVRRAYLARPSTGGTPLPS